MLMSMYIYLWLFFNIYLVEALNHLLPGLLVIGSELNNQSEVLITLTNQR